MRTVDILLVEDNPDDAEMSLYAFNSSLESLTPKLWHVKDGVEALQFIFGSDEQTEANIPIHIKLIILDQ
jgi:CheY-like chemotaxis protein